MKKLTGIMLIIAVLAACKPEENYKKVRDDVIRFHDKAMADHEKIVKNRMRIDTLRHNLTSLKLQHSEIDTLKERAEINSILQRLGDAEDRMNDWMVKFEPDVSGKSNTMAVQYFKNELLKIEQIDSVYKKEIRLSDAYLNKFRNP